MEHWEDELLVRSTGREQAASSGTSRCREAARRVFSNASG